MDPFVRRDSPKYSRERKAITVWHQLLINGLIAGSALGLLAASFAIIYQTARFFHFAHASIYTLAAYLTYLFSRTLGLPFVVSIAASVSLTALAGWLLYVTTYLPIARRNASSTSLLLVSLGLMVALQNIIAMAFGSELKTLPYQPVGRAISIGSALITWVQITSIACSLATLVVLAALLRFTRIGLSLRSVADNAELALIIGVEPYKVTAFAFALGSALAGVSSVLASFDTGLTPTMGFNALLMAVVAVVIGGVGSIPGALLGGLGIGMIRNLAVAAIPTAWIDSLVFVILIGFLLLRPHGMLGEAPARR
ncbi:MAG TPA: branched-chain amino acid ABC transporter permease [Bryobacteraceae bacterium]